MKIRVELDDRGMIRDRYAKHAREDFCYMGTPTCSFPFEVVGIPDDCVSLAWTFTDYDSIPVCGFTWIHWTAAGISASNARGGKLEVPENASNLRTFGMVQGMNSSASRFVGGSDDPLLACRYNGPQPPDKTHEYTLKVFALDCEPNLSEGFWMNELIHEMRGHVLAKAEVNLPARA